MKILIRSTLLFALIFMNVKAIKAQTLSIGPVVGINISTKLGVQSRIWLNVDAGMSRGFSDITRTTDNNYHNLAFGLNVGVSFP